MSVEVAVSNPNLLSALSESYDTNCTINNVKYKLCDAGHLIPKYNASCYFCKKTYSCPNMGEEKVRKYFEDAFNAKFPRVFPEWSAYPGSDIYPLNYLLFHGYNENLKIAFIYAEFKNMTVETKQKMCNEKGIDLIIIPYMTSFSKLKQYSRKQIKKLLAKKNIDIKLETSSSGSSPETSCYGIVDF